LIGYYFESNGKFLFLRFSSKTLMGLLPEKFLVPIEKMIDEGKIQLDFYDILGEVAKLP